MNKDFAIVVDDVSQPDLSKVQCLCRKNKAIALMNDLPICEDCLAGLLSEMEAAKP